MKEPVMIRISKKEWESMGEEKQEYLKALLLEKHGQNIKFYENGEEVDDGEA